jgi:PAS domain-containing protein
VGEISLREFARVSAVPVRDAMDGGPDFRALFESAPGLYLVLDPDFTIVAVSDAWCEATQAARESVIGRNLFEIFVDACDVAAPADPTASGISELRESLKAVLEHRCRHKMAIQKCEERLPDGAVAEHYWSAVNIPVVDETGGVRWIIHSFEDLSETMRSCRDELARAHNGAGDRHKLDRSGRPFPLSVSGTAGWGTFP